MSKNISELSGKKGLKYNLFEQIAKDSRTPENKKVYVCEGASCVCAGTQDQLKNTLKKHFKKDEIGVMQCLGRCHENSAFHFKGQNYSNLSDTQITEVLKGNQKLNQDNYSVFASSTAILTAPIQNPKTVVESFLKQSPEALLKEIEHSGLRGRGGAGFPIAIKLSGLKTQNNPTKFIVCNADEGDPGAFTDRYILEQNPYALLVGMMLAGFVAGAKTGVVYIRYEYPESIQTIQKSIEQLQAENLLGENILGTNFSFHFKVISAQGSYICGEETALLNSIEGKRPEVRTRPPFPVEQGLFNRPTLVNNVETLANLPWIVENGGQKYAALGKGRSTGTKLVSLDSGFKKPGVLEVEMGTPLKEIIEILGGGFSRPVKALHIGGPLGGIVPVDKIKDLDLSFESFAENHFLLGHASIVCISEAKPMIEYLTELMHFAADESCGKCFPCRLGTWRGYEMFQNAQKGDKINPELLKDLLETLEKGSLCAHGGGIPLPVKNAFEYFGAELNQFVE